MPFVIQKKGVSQVARKKKYVPTKFMAKTSHYDKSLADFAVAFI